MKLGFVSDSLSGQSFTDMLDNAQRIGVDGIEVNTGGWSTAPHCDLKKMLSDASERRAFLGEFEARGLEIVLKTPFGWPVKWV
jgi:sugar phosphate isomerase/epimerase